MKKILVLASANRDLILEMDHMPAPGETFRAERYGHAAGGKGSNAAVALARQGAKITISTCLGNDDNGKSLFETYEKEGMDTRAVHFTDDAQTGFALCTVERDGNSRIIVVAGANEHIRFSDIPAEILEEDFDAMMTQFEVPFDAVKDACAWAAKKKIPVIIDAGPALPLPLEELEGVTIFSPNETECEIFTGISPSTPENCLRASLELLKRVDAKYIVLKLGGRGCFVCDGKYYYCVPSYDTTVVDTTAAGDAFTAGLVLHYLQNGSIVQAAQYGNVVGAITVSRAGASTSIPSEAEVAKFIERNDISFE